MCGIAGSKFKTQAFEHYKDNLTRGYYSSGSMIIDTNNQHTIKKVLGTFNEAVECPVVPGIYTKGQYFLYHSRGPTTETKEFVPDNNHPFVFNQWIVAHNGIISNFAKLWKTYCPLESIEGKTDSCIIPRILSREFTIAEALEKLEGTFAVWMYNTDNNKLYVARSGSTLFANTKTGDFSSTEFEGSEPLGEGMVYSIANYYNIEPAGRFKHKSPYFVF